MSEVKWIKLNTNMFEDEKIKLIEALPNADTILIIWVKLLAQAGKTNATGYIYLSENIPYTDEMLATIFNRPITSVRLALNTFQQFGMIEINGENFISISNWEKHQNIDGMEKIREQNRIRKQRERERKKNRISSRDSHKRITGHHATEIDKDIDKDKEEDIDKDIDKEEDKDIKDKDIKDKDIKDIYSNEFEQFWNIYPRKVDKKKSFKAFKKAIKNHSLETILFGTQNYVLYTKNTDKQYIKYPTTFLNNESFVDGYEEVAKGENQSAKTKHDAYDNLF